MNDDKTVGVMSPSPFEFESPMLCLSQTQHEELRLLYLRLESADVLHGAAELFDPDFSNPARAPTREAFAAALDGLLQGLPPDQQSAMLDQVMMFIARPRRN